MLGNKANAVIIICANIITLLILSIGIIAINFFTEETKITKQMIVGINPMTKSSMFYQEPLTVMIEKQEIQKESKQALVKIEEEIENANIDVDIEIKQLVDNQEEITNQAIVDKQEEVREVKKQLNIVPTQYKGYVTIGKIEIPKTGVNTPILNQVTVNGMENAPCLLYSTGELNQNGNNLIVGHNYRNGTLFSNNKNLGIGDKIYITTLNGEKVEYTIYNKFVTTAEDVSYIKRDTNGKPEITLSCCTDDDVYRIIILART